MRLRPQAWVTLFAAAALTVVGLACDGAGGETSNPDAGDDARADDETDASVLGDTGDAHYARNCTPIDDKLGQYGGGAPHILLSSAVPQGTACSQGDACNMNAVRPFCPYDKVGTLRTYFCLCPMGIWECTDQYVAGGAGHECYVSPRPRDGGGDADASTD